MITSLAITLAQGLALHSACIEISEIELDAYQRKNLSETYKRVNTELSATERPEEEAEAELIVTGLRFKADVWVNENTKASGKPAFDLMSADQSEFIEIDFEKNPAIADHFDKAFGEQATRTQRLEATCEKYIRDVLVNELRA